MHDITSDTPAYGKIHFVTNVDARSKREIVVKHVLDSKVEREVIVNHISISKPLLGILDI